MKTRNPRGSSGRAVLSAPSVAFALATLASVTSLAAQSQRCSVVPMKFHLPQITQDIEAATFADFDADGRLDLVVGRRGAAPTLWRGLADGVFAPMSFGLTQEFVLVKKIAPVDTDGDGDLDLLVAERSGLRYLQRQPNGSYLDVTNGLLGVLTSVEGFEAADWDGDGDVDLFVHVSDFVGSRLYLNDGLGRYSPGAAPFSSRVFSATSGDLDGDGDEDIVVGALASIRLGINDGSGNFTEVDLRNTGLSLGAPLALRLADLDVDGDVDLLCQYRDSVRTVINRGNGRFVDESALRVPSGMGGERLEVADFNGDGAPDAVLAPTDRLLINNGSGHFLVATNGFLSLPTGHTQALAVADVDGDGHADIFMGRAGGQAALQINDGTGRFADGARSRVTAPPAPYDRLAVADFTGDGRADIFFAGSFDPDATVLLGSQRDGSYVPLDATQMPALPDAAVAVLSVDVNLDGRPDLITTHRGVASLVHFNHGLGVWSAQPLTVGSTVFDRPGSLAAGDVTGDGSLDLLVGSGEFLVEIPIQGSGPSLLRGTGSRFFTASFDPSTPMTSLGVALADLDGDGDLDAIFANDGQDRIYLNDGTGAFTDVTATALPAAAPAISTSVTVGDVDGDGDPDLCFGRHGGRNGPVVDAEILLNDGSGVFTSAPSVFQVPLGNATKVEFVDFDLDGAIDLVASNPVRLLRNYSGQLRDVTRGWFLNVGITAPGFAVADLEQDGDMDFVFTAAGDSAIQLNQDRRHAVSDRVARLGRSYGLRLVASAGFGPVHAYLFSPSLAPASIPTPFGLFDLDPSIVVAVPPTGVLSQSNLDLVIPNSPSLAGAFIHWQAIANDRFGNMHLTNVVSDQIWR